MPLFRRFNRLGFMTKYRTIILQSKIPAFFAVIFLFLSLFSLSYALDVTEIKDIRYWSSKGYTRIVVDLSKSTDISSNRISGPDRLYFDFKNSIISKEINNNLPISDGILKTVRAGQYSKDTVRLVLDLEEIKDYSSFFLDDPARLVIDVNGNEREAKPLNESSLITKIVLDPGHGGHDPGAVGPNGVYEKEIVLDIALRVKKLLQENKNVMVFLTRETDVFIPLEERTAFANSKNADLFVSIHANAHTNRIVRGVETYMLNWTDDEEAIKVAARENAISVKKMKEHTNRYRNDVDKILVDLMRENNRDESVKLANYVQRSIISTLGDNYSSINDRGVRGALFYVLLGAKMPAILAEVSFISNPIEEKLLSKDNYRDYISRAIVKGIESYMNVIPADQKMAGWNSKSPVLR